MGHHGYIKIPLNIGNKKTLVARTENSMLVKDFRNKIPYFSIENKLLIKNRNYFRLFVTTAGTGSQLQIRRRLGYENLGSWNISTFFNPLSYFYNKTLRKLKRVNFFSENNVSIIEKKKIECFNIKTDITLEDFSLVCKKNLNKEYIEAYPCKDYLKWRFIDCPYHNYFILIIENLDNGENIGVVWYELFKGLGQYDIIIEYLSIKNKKEIKKTLKILKLIFNSFGKCRLIYRYTKKNNTKNNNKNKKLSKILIFSNDQGLKNKQYYFDSFLRQGIAS